MSYSADLRQRVVLVTLWGMPGAEVADTFQVGLTTIARWVAAYHATGILAPTPPPGRAPQIPVAQHPLLGTQLEAAPDATLDQHVAAWAATSGVRGSRWTMSRAIAAMGWTRKKRR